MTEDKNIIKGNKFADVRTPTSHHFYAVIEVKYYVLDAEGKRVAKYKSIVENAYGSRIRAKRELEAVAKANSGKVTYFGGYRN